jgi:hypothetical protein
MALKQRIFFFKNAFTTVDCKLSNITIHSIAGSYVTDPIKYLNIVLQYTPFIVIGADCGGGFTKLGITYWNKQKITQFTALLIFNQKDVYESFNYFNKKDILQFNGDSIQYHTIYEVLQHIIDIKKNISYLNGDWNSISSLLGLSSAVATYPCFICIVEKSSLQSFSKKQIRKQHQIQQHSQKNPPLLLIAHDRIVPIPLHLFLGIGNKITGEVLVDELKVDEKQLQQTIDKVKSISSSPGAAAIHSLNGKELYNWSKTSNDFLSPPEDSSMKVAIVLRWIRELGEVLFHRRVWDRLEEKAFSRLVEEIVVNWEAVTNTAITPKVHMLRHADRFVQLHHALGRYSESHIESYHAKFNTLYLVNHRNKSRDKKERIRRTHADLLLRSIKDCSN